MTPISRSHLLSYQLLVAVVALAAWHVGSSVPVVHFYGWEPIYKLFHLQALFDLFGWSPPTEKTYLLPPFFFSTPKEVAIRVVKMFWDGTEKILFCHEPMHVRTVLQINDPCFGKTVWQHLLITAIEGLLAFIIGSVGGVVFGFWFARKPIVAAVFEPYIKIMNSLPRVVLAPIFALWLGLGIWSKVALGVTLVFFIVFFNVYQGVKEVSPVVLANARMLGMSSGQLFRHVYWPSAMSWMFSSLHTSVGFAVIGAVVGEYLGAAAGLGYLIQQAENTFDVTGVFAGMVILAAFVLLIDFGVTLVERRLLSWRPPAASAQQV